MLMCRCTGLYALLPPDLLNGSSLSCSPCPYPLLLYVLGVNTKEKKDLLKFFATGFRFVRKMPSFRAHSVRFFTPEPKEINCIAHWLAYVHIDFSGGFVRQNK